MKKLLSLLMVAVVIGSTSCKKENVAKPAPQAPQTSNVKKTTTGVYDYQKAKMVKRMDGGEN